MDSIRLIFAIIIIVYALFHLYGFINEWFLATAKEIAWKKIIRLSPKLSKVVGIAWLVTGLIFLLTAGGLVLGAAWWWITAIIGVILSQLLIILYLEYAWFGTIINILIIAAVIWLD